MLLGLGVIGICVTSLGIYCCVNIDEETEEEINNCLINFEQKLNEYNEIIYQKITQFETYIENQLEDKKIDKTSDDDEVELLINSHDVENQQIEKEKDKIEEIEEDIEKIEIENDTDDLTTDDDSLSPFEEYVMLL